MSNSRRSVGAFLALAALADFPAAGRADIFTLTIDGPDAIYLAGRTDVTVPNLGSSFILARHGYVLPDFVKEKFPQSISVVGGDVVKVADPAVGGIDFYNGTGNFYGPEGNGADGSNLNPLGGLSGYKGPQGALAGVFLDDSVPSSGTPPAILDFGPGGLGRDFTILSPELRQVFFIGDGVNGSSQLQSFVAPAGSTRLFLGIPDGFGFVGAPGAYEDNDGSYRIRIGVNENPNPVPEPATLALVGMGIAGIAFGARRKKSK